VNADAETPRVGADVLRSSEVGGQVIRGGALRVGAYGAGLVLVAAASVLLLRHLGVVEFGRYVTVMSLIAIVSGVADAGLTAVGARELAMRSDPVARRRLVGSLVTLRLVLTPIGVALAVGFAVLAGYDSVLIEGTLLAGAGLVLVALQVTLTAPLGVELKNGRLALFEVVKQFVTVAGIAMLALAGATLLPFFAVQIVVGLALLALTPLVGGRGLFVAPRADRAEVVYLLREAIPIAVALALAQVYFRILVIMLSLMATERATGLFGTSYRIIEMLLLVPAVLFSVVLPVTSVAGAENEARLRYVLQRMTEVGLILSVYLAVAIAIVAEPVIEILGGPQYVDAASALRIQVFALIGFFLNQAWATVLISIGEQRRIAISNALALASLFALGLALIPRYGIEGAATAAVVADALLAGLLFVAITRARRGLAPDMAFAWKVVVAAGLAAAALLVPGSLPWVELVVATVVYWAAVGALRLMPPEVKDALPRLRSGGLRHDARR
jgi:O-antigen/teichoic acid export membrane protein